MKKLAVLRAIVAGVMAGAVLVIISLQGQQAVFAAPLGVSAFIVVFSIARLMLAWRPRMNQVLYISLVLLGSYLALAALFTLLFARGTVTAQNIHAGAQLIAIGIYMFWPTVLLAAVLFAILDIVLVRAMKVRP